MSKFTLEVDTRRLVEQGRIGITNLIDQLKQRFLGQRATTNSETGKEDERSVEQISVIVDQEIEYFKRHDYAHVICFLCSGGIEGEQHNIFELAESLGWQVNSRDFGDPSYYSDESGDVYIPVETDLENEWGSFLRENIATQSTVRTPPNHPDKSIHLFFEQGFDRVGAYVHPRNGFDANVVYNVETIKRLGQEMALIALEEWLHVLQHEQQAFISSRMREVPYSGTESVEAEHDVAFYLMEKGADITDTVFIHRYKRKQVLNGSK